MYKKKKGEGVVSKRALLLPSKLFSSPHFGERKKRGIKNIMSGGMRKLAASIHVKTTSRRKQ